MAKHLICSLLLIVASAPIAFTQGIVAVRQPDGKVVWENAPAAAISKASPVPAAEPVAESGFVYWNSKLHRYVPVPPANSNSMRAARAAAAEVRRLVQQAAKHDAVVAASVATERAERPKFATTAKPVSTHVATAQRKTMQAAHPAAVASISAPLTVDQLIEEAAQRHGIDSNLVRAIIKVESNFNPRAVSKKGAVGLMQLMPSTARSLNVNPYDPRQNLDAGITHLKSLLDNYGGNIELTLAAYNAGPGAVQRNGGIPPYAETRSYVKRITQLYAQQESHRFLGSSHNIHESRDAAGHLSFTDLE